MTLESPEDIENAVADPTRFNTGSISLEINRSATSLLAADPGITVVQLSPTIKLTVNVNNARGEMDFAFRARASQTNSTGGFHVRNAAGTSAVTVAFGSTGSIYTYNGGATTNLLTYAADTWYSFRIVARPSNDTFDLYIDGTQVVFNQSFRNAVTTLDEVYLHTSIAQTGTFHFDEIIIR